MRVREAERGKEGRKEGRGEALSGRWGTDRDHGRMDGRRAAGLIMQLPLSLSLAYVDSI